jgi:hypothetical protein
VSERKIPEPEAVPPDQDEMRRRAGLASVFADMAARNGCPDVAERLDRLAGHYNGRLRRTARGEPVTERAVRS